MLSQDGLAISKESIKGVVEELPLMCIKTMDKLIQQLYQGTTLTWLQFLSALNDKKTVPNKEGLLRVFGKWMSRTQLSSPTCSLRH